MILTRQKYKNIHVTVIEIFQKKKKKKVNMQGIDMRTYLMRKTEN